MTFLGSGDPYHVSFSILPGVYIQNIQYIYTLFLSCQLFNALFVAFFWELSSCSKIQKPQCDHQKRENHAAPVLPLTVFAAPTKPWFCHAIFPWGWWDHGCLWWFVDFVGANLQAIDITCNFPGLRERCWTRESETLIKYIYIYILCVFERGSLVFIRCVFVDLSNPCGFVWVSLDLSCFVSTSWKDDYWQTCLSIELIPTPSEPSSIEKNFWLWSSVAEGMRRGACTPFLRVQVAPELEDALRDSHDGSYGEVSFQERCS